MVDDWWCFDADIDVDVNDAVFMLMFMMFLCWCWWRCFDFVVDVDVGHLPGHFLLLLCSRWNRVGLSLETMWLFFIRWQADLVWDQKVKSRGVRGWSFHGTLDKGHIHEYYPWGSSFHLRWGVGGALITCAHQWLLTWTWIMKFDWWITFRA